MPNSMLKSGTQSMMRIERSPLKLSPGPSKKIEETTESDKKKILERLISRNAKNL